MAVSLDDVKRNFAAYGLRRLASAVREGLFKDPLGKLDNERFALIRLDGDMYESTMDALTALYDKVSPGSMSSWTTMAASPLAVRSCMIFLTSGGWHQKPTAVGSQKEDRDRAARA
ncbi:TylF/MycF/NovP-related O-methyltransferase [Mesorhizobium sp. M3A.F.Ca.ET.080.04.2.1]|uniref:TylF/MycF/NovP-related O-methyltransferase n=1 Tax=Mesorhizobium sp. M3A.F.Ca.ET.080.04.2.1 TaxID=2493676 RepID=UPI0032B0173F